MLILNGESRANSLVFTPDGTRLVVGRGDGRIELWALPEGKLVRDFGNMTIDPALSLHPSGRVLLVGDIDMFGILWLQNGTFRAEPPGAQSVWVSSDGRWAVSHLPRIDKLIGRSCNPDGNLHIIWEREFARGTLCNFVSKDRFVTIDFDNNGKGRLSVCEAATGKVLSSVPYLSSYVYHTATSPDGSRFAAMGYEKLYVWDTATWSKPTRVETRFGAFAFHPTQPLFIAVQRGQQLVKFFDTVNWKLQKRFAWKLGEVISVAFSPDGTLAVAGTASGKVIVWDVDE